MNLLDTIRDASNEYEAGVDFDTELSEIRDIDSDGIIEPILVYRFFNKDKNSFDTSAFSGRIKIIMFYKAKKIVIRASSGTLDDERSTTANENFFLLPKQIQHYLVKKMTEMYKNDIFGFDNSHNAMPIEQNK